MQIRTQLPAKQKGFSVLSGIILTIVMLGSLAFFLAGQGVNVGFGATYSNTARASSLLASAGYIGAGFDSVLLSGTTAGSVTFDSGSAGVFNPSTGGASPQTLDPGLFTDVSTPATATVAASGVHGYWIYRKNDIKLNGVGTASAEYTIVASGLKQSVCQQINSMLYGSSVVDVLAKTEALLVGGTPSAGSNNTVSGTALDLSALGTSGRLNACYQTTEGSGPDKYIYIHTLLAQ